MVTLTSETRCADIICKPLEVQVTRLKKVKELGKLVAKIEEFLASTTGNEYSWADIENLKVGETDYATGKYPLGVGIDYGFVKEKVSRKEVVALVSTIQNFIKTPSLWRERLIPLSYKDKTFLVNLNGVTNNDYEKVCNAIDEGKLSPMDISNPFKIAEETFNKETNNTYPFKFYPELNEKTGENYKQE